MKSSRSDWFVPAFFVFLCLVPLAAGVYRLVQMASGAVPAADSRFADNPLPAVVHITSALAFCVLGAFQIGRAPRARSLWWHRMAGRVLGPLGVVGGLSGVWLTLAYWTITRDGPVLFCLRLVAGTAMAACVLLAMVRVLQKEKDLAAHRAWMVRGYALGLGAGTQFFTHLPWLILGDMPNQLETTVAMAAGWLINLAVAEWRLRGPSLFRDVVFATRGGRGKAGA